jgi:hypothetical protein
VPAFGGEIGEGLLHGKVGARVAFFHTAVRCVAFERSFGGQIHLCGPPEALVAGE